MDMNKIFDSFLSSQEDSDSLLIDFSNHPLYWIGGFNKVMDNDKFFYRFIVKMLNTQRKQLPIKEIKEASDTLMFEKAWNYIKNIDINNSLHIEYLQNSASKEFYNNLDLILSFFEKNEKYEKCALLRDIKNFTIKFI